MAEIRAVPLGKRAIVQSIELAFILIVFISPFFLSCLGAGQGKNTLESCFATVVDHKF